MADANQLELFDKISKGANPVHANDSDTEFCEVCGDPATESFDGKYYCDEHSPFEDDLYDDFDDEDDFEEEEEALEDAGGGSYEDYDDWDDDDEYDLEDDAEMEDYVDDDDDYDYDDSDECPGCGLPFDFCECEDD